MTDSLSTLAPHFFQVAYVVPELATAEAWFQRVMGVPHFVRLENVHLGEGCRYRGRPADSEMHLALGYLADTQIELIESVRGPSLYTEFLEARGPGLHHVAFAVPDFAETVRRLESEGLERIQDGILSGGMTVEFAYFDCAMAGAAVVEILGFDDAARAFMEGIKTGAPSP